MGESGAGRADLTAAGWSRLHYGIDPAGVPLLRGWLRLVTALARPLHRVPPLVLTVAGAVCAVAAVFVASALPWLALALVLAAVLCDGLDGAVAVQAGRATAAGSVADKLADRIADTAFALVIWRCGAPLWLAVLAAALSLVHEGIRVVRGGRALSTITVAERPSRTICTVLACAAVGITPDAWPATVCAAVWVGLAVIGLGQLLRA
jgi:archaetidylinositol phosphate synthase